jgi:hypothetical protein
MCYSSCQPTPSGLAQPGCWVLGAGCWVLGAGRWVLETSSSARPGLRTRPFGGVTRSTLRRPIALSDTCRTALLLRLVRPTITRPAMFHIPPFHIPGRTMCLQRWRYTPSDPTSHDHVWLLCLPCVSLEPNADGPTPSDGCGDLLCKIGLHSTRLTAASSSTAT